MIPVCPKCDTALLILQWHGVEVDFCDQCCGLWLDAGELEELMTQTGAKADDPLLQFQHERGVVAAGRKYLCPRCDEAMPQITPRENLTLERCAHGHGLWFDANELRQLLAVFPAASGVSKTVEFLNEFFNAPAK